MKIERVLNLPINETDTRNRINTYFSQAGYRLVESGGRILTFKRGSKLGSWLPQNPASLLSVAEIEVLPKGSQTDVKAEFNIKATFKDESHFTDEFWTNEISEFETALLNNQYFPLKKKKLNQRTFVANLKSLGPALVYILIWGALSGILTVILINVPGTENFDPYLVAFGVMLVSAIATIVIYRFWKKRRSQAG
jgi:hypothetical protein